MAHMKFNYNIKQDKETKDFLIQYHRVKDPAIFRERYMKSYFHQYGQVLVYINTNLIDEGIEEKAYIQKFEALARQYEVPFKIKQVQNTRGKRLFGMPVGTKAGPAFIGVMVLNYPEFLMFYEPLFYKGDVMLGFSQTTPATELMEQFMAGYETYLYDFDGCEHVIYDSFMVRSVRSNFPDFPDLNASVIG